ncbi:MAG: hypothetical protein IPH04_05965 [Saprospirales bacterium]|nr:hypothetical protein [Saprospirales bacterium]
MNILLLLLIIPALTLAGLFLSRGKQQPRVVAALGMGLQFLAAFYLLFSYLRERAQGNAADMLFTSSYDWYTPLNISLDLGVDGVSIALILLTSIVILAGVLISWQMEDLPKEFFISLITLGTGVFGFFICIDLFSMFLFYELAVVPMYLLIGIWGSGPKEYAAMKLTLMLMAGSAFLLVGMLGLYFFSAGPADEHTFNIMEIAASGIPVEMQRIFFPLTFIGFGVLGALFPFHTWSPDGHSSAPTAVSMLHAGVLMKLGGYGCFRVAIFLMPQAAAMGGLLKVLPFISACYVIAGLASLGLPGLSGFVAELSIFVGAFENPDTFHRFWTILSVSAIVVTAVYILRVVGTMLMGPLKEASHASLAPASWYEKTGALLLVIPIAGIGLAPLWLSDMIQFSLAPIMRQLGF